MSIVYRLARVALLLARIALAVALFAIGYAAGGHNLLSGLALSLAAISPLLPLRLAISLIHVLDSAGFG
jgi:hypothetical protein